eukprot:2057484-Rhodomonas_salina.1
MLLRNVRYYEIAYAAMLRLCYYAVCGTEQAYGATNLCGTELGYGPRCPPRSYGGFLRHVTPKPVLLFDLLYDPTV